MQIDERKIKENTVHAIEEMKQISEMHLEDLDAFSSPVALQVRTTEKSLDLRCF